MHFLTKSTKSCKDLNYLLNEIKMIVVRSIGFEISVQFQVYKEKDFYFYFTKKFIKYYFLFTPFSFCSSFHP